MVCARCQGFTTGHLKGGGKKITNYAEIFRNIMRKKVLIMKKTSWIRRKIFGSLRSPKIASFRSAKIALPPIFGPFQLFSFIWYVM